MKDLHGDIHRLEVKVLGTEETWNTPSLILASDTNCNGIAVFSQVSFVLKSFSSIQRNTVNFFAKCVVIFILFSFSFYSLAGAS